MINETVVTVVGNVASDLRPRRVGESDERVVGFRVAGTERRWDRGTESWVDGDRFSAWVTCWRRLAEGVVMSLAKGDPVVVTGRLATREYTVGEERRYSTEITASAVGPDLARSTAVVSRRPPRAAAPPTEEAPAESPTESPTDAAPATTDPVTPLGDGGPGRTEPALGVAV